MLSQPCSVVRWHCVYSVHQSLHPCSPSPRASLFFKDLLTWEIVPEAGYGTVGCKKAERHTPHTASLLPLPLETRVHLDKEVALSCGVTFRGCCLWWHASLSLKLGDWWAPGSLTREADFKASVFASGCWSWTPSPERDSVLQTQCHFQNESSGPGCSHRGTASPQSTRALCPFRLH